MSIQRLLTVFSLAWAAPFAPLAGQESIASSTVSLYSQTEFALQHISSDYDCAHIIPMILCPDARYLPHAGVTVTSLLENASNSYAYDIYILSDHLLTDAEKAPWFELSEQYAGVVNFNISFVDGSLLIEDRKLSGGPWGQTALYRLMAPEMDIFAQYEKLIYIDCDMIVYDIISFWTQSFDLEEGEEAWFAAVKDKCQVEDYLCDYVIEHLEKTNVAPSGFSYTDYVSSGLLLMNLKELRAHHFTSSAVELIKGARLLMPDQDAINILAFKKIKILDLLYAYPFMLTQTKPEGTYVLHYLEAAKPWKMKLPKDPDLISSLSEYHFYRQKSPWKIVTKVSQDASSGGDLLSALGKWRSRKLRAQEA